MLAEEGMLYDEVCFGTKATTERSDTCVKRHTIHKSWYHKRFRQYHILIRKNAFQANILFIPEIMSQHFCHKITT